MSNKNKRGRLSQPNPLEGERIASARPTDQLKPVWCLCYLQRGWDIAELDQKQKAAVMDALWERTALTWGQIKLAPRKGLGREPIEQNSIRAGIPPIMGRDRVEVFNIDTGRIAGVRRDEKFHVVWIDFKFKLYKHDK